MDCKSWNVAKMLMGHTTNKNKCDDLWPPCWMCPPYQLLTMLLQLWQWHPQKISSLTNSLCDSYSLSKTYKKEAQTELYTVMAVYRHCSVGVYHGSWRRKSCTGCRNEIAGRTQERNFAWSHVQALNMFLVLDKIREKDGWKGHISWMKVRGYPKVAFRWQPIARWDPDG